MTLDQIHELKQLMHDGFAQLSKRIETLENSDRERKDNSGVLVERLNQVLGELRAPGRLTLVEQVTVVEGIARAAKDKADMVDKDLKGMKAWLMSTIVGTIGSMTVAIISLCLGYLVKGGK